MLQLPSDSVQFRGLTRICFTGNDKATDCQTGKLKETGRHFRLQNNLLPQMNMGTVTFALLSFMIFNSI